MRYYSGRHGSIPSSEVENLIVRNGNFCTVLRAGAGDGVAGVFNSVTGKYLMGLGGGRIPEWSYMRDEEPKLVRGWRPILYELLHKRHIRATPEICKVLGTRIARDVVEYGMGGQPMESPTPSTIYVDGSMASGM